MEKSRATAGTIPPTPSSPALSSSKKTPTTLMLVFCKPAGLKQVWICCGFHTQWVNFQSNYNNGNNWPHSGSWQLPLFLTCITKANGFMYSCFQEGWVFSSWENYVPESLPSPLSPDVLLPLWHHLQIPGSWDHQPISSFLPILSNCLSKPTEIWFILLQLAHAQWLFNLSPTEVPYPYSLIPREMCISSFILTMWFLNPGVGVLALEVCFDVIMGLTSSLTTLAKRVVLAHHQEDHTYQKQEGGNKAKETLPQLHLLSCGWGGRGPGSVLRKAWKDPCRWKPLGDCGPHSMPSLSVVLVSVSCIPFSLQRLCVSALSLSIVSDTAHI